VRDVVEHVGLQVAEEFLRRVEHSISASGANRWRFMLASSILKRLSPLGCAGGATLVVRSRSDAMGVSPLRLTLSRVRGSLSGRDTRARCRRDRLAASDR
jgi:hypothetical protein